MVPDSGIPTRLVHKSYDTMQQCIEASQQVNNAVRVPPELRRESFCVLARDLNEDQLI